MSGEAYGRGKNLQRDLLPVIRTVFFLINLISKISNSAKQGETVGMKMVKDTKMFVQTGGLCVWKRRKQICHQMESRGRLKEKETTVTTNEKWFVIALGLFLLCLCFSDRLSSKTADQSRRRAHCAARCQALNGCRQTDNSQFVGRKKRVFGDLFVLLAFWENSVYQSRKERWEREDEHVDRNFNLISEGISNISVCPNKCDNNLQGRENISSPFNHKVSCAFWKNSTAFFKGSLHCCANLFG